MSKQDPKIKYVTWRNGRPRFIPSPSLRERGLQGFDLISEVSGTWMTAGEALDWSRTFEDQLVIIKKNPKIKPKQKPASLPEKLSFYTVESLLRDYATSQDFRDRASKTQMDYLQKIRSIEMYAKEVWKSEAEAVTKPICKGIYDDLRQAKGLHVANGAMRILGIAYSWAMDRGKLPAITVNPAHKLKMKSPDPRVRAGTKEEIAHFVKVADELGRYEIGDMIILAVWSGQRQGDRLDLQFSSRQNGRLRLRQSKTRARVDMPEAEELKQRLENAAKRRAEAEVISPYVILDERVWEPFKPDHYRKQYNRVRRFAAKTMPSLATLRDQDLRDTAVTWLALAGCELQEICAITGHSLDGAAQIFKHYMAIHPDMADSAIDKLETWYKGK
ncbi:tyrosine-type recombinase/integrase [Martelella alba]|nr:tyrosine-type recombinase/integrase [Martelella alba]